MTDIVLAGIVVFITHAIEAVTGFGCSVLAMPFVTALLGMRTGIMVITVLAWLLAVYIAVTKWRAIDWKQFSIITGCMLIGLPIGMYLFRTVDGANLQLILAIFICIVSIWQLIKKFRDRGKKTAEETTVPTKRRFSGLPYYLLLVVGGIVHGMFSSGGPLVVLYASKHLPDKSRFRATLCLLWATLNTIIMASYFVDGMVDVEFARTTGLLVPFVIAGIIVGEKIHDKVNERTFTLIVFSMLLLTGIFMLWK